MKCPVTTETLSKTENSQKAWPVPESRRPWTQTQSLHARLSVPQGRHVKTGQLAAIKVMDVTEVGSHGGRRRAGTEAGWGLSGSALPFS